MALNLWKLAWFHTVFGLVLGKPKVFPKLLSLAPFSLQIMPPSRGQKLRSLICFMPILLHFSLGFWGLNSTGVVWTSAKDTTHKFWDCSVTFPTQGFFFFLIPATLISPKLVLCCFKPG